MKEFWQKLSERLTGACLQLLDQHPGKVIGLLAGLILGLIVVLLGFWRTLIIMLFAGAGFYLGKRRDEHKDFSQFLQTFFGERK